MDWIEKNEMKHPDNIAKVGYDHQHTHDGELFNEALKTMSQNLLE